MSDQAYHEMVLDNIHPSGAEEWYCPTCGRRFLMQWPPAYNKVILEAGDETAIHSGGKGTRGSSLIPATDKEMTPQVEDMVLIDIDPQSLRPWEEWFEKVDFENLWNK